MNPAVEGVDIRGDLVEDTLHAVRKAGHRMSWDATEPRLEEEVSHSGSGDAMAVLLSHVPPRVRYGV